MNPSVETAQVGIEKGHAEVAQLLAVGAVRILLNDDFENHFRSEPDTAETSDDGLEDS